MGLDDSLAKTFAANPVHGPQQHSRQGLDPRLARKFLRSGDMALEEKQKLQTYVSQSGWIPNERAVYSSVVDGFSTVAEIQTVTGLSLAEVETTIGMLTSKGLVRKVKDV